MRKTMEDLEKTKNISKSGGNYGNYPQKQKSVGERISDSIFDIGFRITLKHIHAMMGHDDFGIALGFQSR
ncbi:hypothetical protein MF1_07460 [Bartonella quintana]|uniref:hypothetical protein n=1 Tax=Bartonella quintana TaxID=803 RepID=UPI00027FC98F|nr:hypothetical protein [Bartonella quintana]AFR26233.1 hypothetical protein RM11_0497 [Bartonella quintana RM-11]BBL53488.1 hypothetical protein MF1_07460 [Bartonella quintana]